MLCIACFINWHLISYFKNNTFILKDISNVELQGLEVNYISSIFKLLDMQTQNKKVSQKI